MFEDSAETGEPINVVQVAVVLEPTAAAPTATVSALAQTGAELPNDSEGSLGVVTVLIAALAALGLGSLRLAYAAQRNRS